MSKITYIGDGRLQNDVYVVVVNDTHRSDRVPGYRLSDQVVEELIDRNVEYITFVDLNRGRYTISVEDWIEYRVWSDVDQWQHVSQTFMSRG